MAKLGFDFFGDKQNSQTENTSTTLSEDSSKKNEKIVISPEKTDVYKNEEGKVEIIKTPEKRTKIVKETAMVINPIISQEMGDNSEERVPFAFDQWFKSIPHERYSVRKAYSLVDQLETSNKEVFDWVNQNEDFFAEIWLGKEYLVKALPLYETTIPNEGKKPNILAKTSDGIILMKPFEQLDDSDETELLEDEICDNWKYLFDNNYSRLIKADEV